ncbi:MAG: 1-deoxy-D-xylulose-5-phosphate synthase [Spirochaetes bacterium]|nr:1-deoxy-D-xylulose-5-phosphate synthase [Spirochaetota bacterium]MBU1081075.1 1-deoxy-D-xylulose-5-phosphate synthase [Spirochaetota bacterium]
MAILESIRGPGDIKRLSVRELYGLAAEIRGLIIGTVTVNGGHLASNLGVVELTLALHRVFETPSDAIVWDVGHQCYTHKIVTGRYEAFRQIRRSGGLSGFPKRAESVHDAFDAGHASTSISAALGLLAANAGLGRSGSVVAVIGDGALTGGMAYEAMSHAGQLGLPLIVVLNDNAMSISRNVGAVSSYLSRLSATARYQRVRRLLDRMILGVPFMGPRLHPLVLRMKRAVKAIFFKENLFVDLGFEYAGPIDGHNIHLLCEVLEEARAIRKPVVVHVVTKKGKGHVPAERNPSAFHGVSPASQPSPAVQPASPDSLSSDPIDPAGAPVPKRPTFTEAFGQAVTAAAGADPRVAAVTAAMSSGTGLSEFHRRYPDRLFDVGIAEEHAVTFAAGMAAGGLRPVVALYSTFLQRAFDQVHHDVALSGLPVVFAVDRAGAVPDDGETHQGLYDIQAFRAVPGMSIVAPASAGELRLALNWALANNGPSIVRYPKAVCPAERPAFAEPFTAGKGVYVRRSESSAPLLFIASGALVDEALSASDACASEGVAADVYNLRFLKPLDTGGVVEMARRYSLVVLAEEGVLTGGAVADLAAAILASGRRAVALGFGERPLPQAKRDELLAQAGLSAASLARTALAALAGEEPAIAASGSAAGPA